MKKILILSLLVSPYSMANNHFYIGTNALVGHNTELKSGSNSIDDSNNPGFSAFGGYNIAVHPRVDLGVELEYQHFGKATFENNTDTKGDAYYINVRPKFIEPNNNLYSAFILGIGALNLDPKGLNSESKFSYQAGVEVGYMIKQVDLSIGYRYRGAKFDNTDVIIQGVTLGARYNF